MAAQIARGPDMAELGADSTDWPRGLLVFVPSCSLSRPAGGQRTLSLYDCSGGKRKREGRKYLAVVKQWRTFKRALGCDPAPRCGFAILSYIVLA